MTSPIQRACSECGAPVFVTQIALERGRGKFCTRVCQRRGALRQKWEKYHATVGEWFWNRMDKGEGEDACWNWKGRKGRRDYGRIVWHGVDQQANRLAAILAHGAPPTSEHFACHTCDNATCCNPRHLWWGTHQDNMADMRAKGRGRWQPNSPALRARAADMQARAEDGAPHPSPSGNEGHDQ